MRVTRGACRIAVMLVGCLVCAYAQDDSWEEDFQSTPPAGKQAFTTTCAGCHGLDGRGSERAPNIASSAKVSRLSDSQVANIISNGVPGTGMPGFHTMTPAQVKELVSYIHVLQGRPEARRLPGDPAKGKEVFFGKAECSTCHAISGEGGFIGPDLTAYGATANVADILKALTSPNRVVPTGYKTAAVTTRDGSRVEGVVRNEDNFSLQLLTKDGEFRFFQKAELEKLDYATQPLMPTDYGKRLARNELNDLIAYLMAAGSTSKPGPNHSGHKKQGE